MKRLFFYPNILDIYTFFVVTVVHFYRYILNLVNIFYNDGNELFKLMNYD